MHLLEFALISLILTVTPGPDFALVTRNSLAWGRKGAVATTLGLAGGVTLWVAASAIGIVAVLEKASGLYSALRIAGGAYLIYLGFSSIRHADGGNDVLQEKREAHQSPSARSIWTQGFTSASLNPKLGVFFVAFFPQFIDRSHAALPQIALLGAIFLAIAVSWIMTVGLTISRLRDWITSSRVQWCLHVVTGAVLILFGVVLLLRLQ